MTERGPAAAPRPVELAGLYSLVLEHQADLGTLRRVNPELTTLAAWLGSERWTPSKP